MSFIFGALVGLVVGLTLANQFGFTVSGLVAWVKAKFTKEATKVSVTVPADEVKKDV